MRTNLPLILRLGLAIGLAIGATPLNAQLRDTKVLTLEAAKHVADVAEAKARENGWNVAIAVVDASGDLVLFRRIDSTPPASVEIAIAKARTAARFRRATKQLEERVAAGRMSLLAVDDMIPLEGGLPLAVGEQTVGGIGVSGVASTQDAVVARAGLGALRP